MRQFPNCSNRWCRTCATRADAASHGQVHCSSRLRRWRLALASIPRCSRCTRPSWCDRSMRAIRPRWSTLRSPPLWRNERQIQLSGLRSVSRSARVVQWSHRVLHRRAEVHRRCRMQGSGRPPRIPARHVRAVSATSSNAELATTFIVSRELLLGPRRGASARPHVRGDDVIRSSPRSPSVLISENYWQQALRRRSDGAGPEHPSEWRRLHDHRRHAS